MSKLKTIKCMIALLLLLPCSSLVYAANIVQDNKAELLHISGTTTNEGQYVTVTIYPKDSSPSLASDYNHIRQISSDASGNYKFSFKPEFATGDYILSVYYNGISNAEKTKEFKFYNFGELGGYVSGMAAMTVEELGDFIELNREGLGVNSKLYNKLIQDNTDLTAFYSKLSHLEFSDLSDFVSDFEETLKFSACSFTQNEAYNHLIENVVGLKNLKIYTVFEQMTDDNKKAVYNRMYGSVTESDEDILRAFSRAVVLTYVKISNWTNVKTLLSEKLDDVANINLTVFNNYPTEISKAVAGVDFTDYNAFETVLLNTPTITPPSNQNGGGGGGGGSILFAPVVPSVPDDTTLENEDKFSDLDGYDWAKDSIQSLAEKKIISGVGNGLFEPERSVYREEFVQMIVNAFKLKGSSKSMAYSDISPSAWYADAVSAAVENGIVKGVGMDFFGVGTEITRQDMCVMLYRTLNSGGVDYSKTKDKFLDDALIADYAKDAVYAVRALGITDGFPDGSFLPYLPATRAQAAVMIERAMSNGGIN